MLLAKPASKRIASSMAQIAANDCSGPQQETQGYQQKSSVRKGQQTGSNSGNYLAKVGVEGSNPFARSRILSILPRNFCCVRRCVLCSE
jgi:hypothetical protein